MHVNLSAGSEGDLDPGSVRADVPPPAIMRRGLMAGENSPDLQVCAAPAVLDERGAGLITQRSQVQILSPLLVNDARRSAVRRVTGRAFVPTTTCGDHEPEHVIAGGHPGAGSGQPSRRRLSPDGLFERQPARRQVWSGEEGGQAVAGSGSGAHIGAQAARTATVGAAPGAARAVPRRGWPRWCLAEGGQAGPCRGRRLWALRCVAYGARCAVTDLRCTESESESRRVVRTDAGDRGACRGRCTRRRGCRGRGRSRVA
jgi:hypothetical protein